MSGGVIPLTSAGAGRSSEVERSLMVRSVVGSTLHGEPIELFLISANPPKAILCAVLSVR